jgi:hypothetical protein
MNIADWKKIKLFFSDLSALGLFSVPFAVRATDAIERTVIQAQYEEEVLACQRDAQVIDRHACVREADAARALARHQNLVELTASQRGQNRLLRC